MLTCSHHRTEDRKRDIRGGTFQIREQCLDCGEALGNAKARGNYDLNALRPFDEEFFEEQNLLRDLESRTKWEQRASDRRTKYQRYLSSTEWKTKRDLVMLRAANRCEGCQVERATEVHHLTYEHIYQEFLWELVAVCRKCHMKVHVRYNDSARDNNGEIS